jgi:hypothetical protein
VVSFFLLVVAIECLSNSIIVLESDVPWNEYQTFYGPKFKSIKNSVKFVEFICRYLPPEVLKEEGDVNLLRRRLLSAYHIRNGFVHNGEDLPRPVAMADLLGRRSIAYVAVRKEGKEREIRGPALLWLEKIVVSALKGYLRRESGKKQRTTSVFREQARETGIYKIKFRTPHPAVEKYQVMGVDFAKRYFEGDE